MRANRLFWGFVIVLLGVLLLLQTMEFLAWSAWAYFWPAFLILVGLWIFIRPSFKGGTYETTNLSIPLEGSGELRGSQSRRRYADGILRRGRGAILDGTFGGGVVNPWTVMAQPRGSN